MQTSHIPELPRQLGNSNPLIYMGNLRVIRIKESLPAENHKGKPINKPGPTLEYKSFVLGITKSDQKPFITHIHIFSMTFNKFSFITSIMNDSR